MPDNEETTPAPKPFDYSAYPPDTIFYERRTGVDRRATAPAPPPEILERRTQKDRRCGGDSATGEEVKRRCRVDPATGEEVKPRRGRVDPTTFDKQYTKDEVEFGQAMSRFITQTGKKFPSAGDTLKVLYSLGYRRMIPHLAETQEPRLVELN